MERFRHLFYPPAPGPISVPAGSEGLPGQGLLLPRCLYGDPVSTRAGFGRILRAVWQTGSWGGALQNEELVPLDSQPGAIILLRTGSPEKRRIAWHFHWIQSCLIADWPWQKEWLTAEVVAGQRALVLAGMRYWWFALATMSESSTSRGYPRLVPAFGTYDDSDLIFFRRIVAWQLSYCLLVQALWPRLMSLWGSDVSRFDRKMWKGSLDADAPWRSHWRLAWQTFLHILSRTMDPKNDARTMQEQYDLIEFAYHEDVVAWLRAEILNGSTSYSPTALTERPRESDEPDRDSLVEEVFWAKGRWPLWSGHLPCNLEEGASPFVSMRIVAFRTRDHRAVARAIESLLPDRAAYVAPSVNGWVCVMDYDLDYWNTYWTRDGASPPLYSDELASTVARHCRCPAFSYDFRLWGRCWLYDEDGERVEAIPDESEPVRSDGWAPFLHSGERPGYHRYLHDRLRAVFAWDGALGPFECYGSYHSEPPDLEDLRASARDLTTILASLEIPYTRLNYETLLRLSSFLDDEALPGWSEFIRVGETYEQPEAQVADG